MSAIHEKLVAVTRQIALEGIGKTRKNAQQGYNFRGVDEVMNAFAPILAAHGLFIRPRFMGREVIERQSSKGGALFYITVKGEFDFVCDNGESVTVGPFYGEAMDSADKATNKAMATAFKYAMFQTFCVPLEGVTGGDADSVTHEVKAATKTAGKPTDGAWDSFNEEARAYLTSVAGECKRLFEAGQIGPCVTKYETGHDSDERVAMWTLFDSKMRAAMKRYKDENKD